MHFFSQLEHLIQASDVSHTMQHWHVFRKWNENLFCEMYTAYKQGRAENDPSVNWYKSEIGFFDFYIIPLAKKLKECGVFGVSSGEYLSTSNYCIVVVFCRGCVTHIVRLLFIRSIHHSFFFLADYAMHNRKEWELKGEEVVAEMIAKYKDVDVQPAVPVQVETSTAGTASPFKREVWA